MSFTAWIHDPFTPYLVLVLCGFLPTEIWRLAGALFSRRLTLESEVFTWIKFVATALLAAVVAKLIVTPVGSLADVSLIGRVGGVVSGVAAYLIFRRSIAIGVVIAEAVLMASMLL